MGYVLSYRSSWSDLPKENYWGLPSDLDVELETFDARILNAKTGETIASFQISVTAPEFVEWNQGWTRLPIIVSDERIISEIQAAFEEKGLEWPFPNEQE